MKIRTLECKELKIPFNVSFQHSSALRNETESILVKCHTHADITGVGEGCPRSYVTGETVDSALTFFSRGQAQWSEISSLSDLIEWISIHQLEIDANPAAFAAVEISILNALSLEANVSVEALLGLPEVEGRFSYTAVLGTANTNSFRSQLEQYLKVGFRDYKIKLFGSPEIDKPNLQRIEDMLGERCTVRFDANNLWKDADEAVRYLSNIDVSYFAVEEPIAVQDFEGLSLASENLGKKIILDESFLRKADFDFLGNSPECWIINLRISKMGGVIRSMEIAETAKQVGVPIIVGAQVGETSILTRAALTVANSYKDILLAQEGAYGTHLLSYDVLDPPLMFGKEGVLDMDTV